jgi:ABC-type transport system involved in cytochrome bd biosynthesis fused ATPase/permease subunit
MTKRPKQEQPTEIEIKVTGLHKAFDDHKILRGVSLEIHPGDVIAIVGGSGCGKTVLLNHILGQLDPDKGTIQVTDHMAGTPELIDSLYWTATNLIASTPNGAWFCNATRCFQARSWITLKCG